MEDKYLSRRNFLINLSRYGVILGGSSLIISKTSGMEKLTEYINSKFLFDYKDELYKNAPIARYWTSTVLKNADCRYCHSPNEIYEKTHVHKEKTVKCLLCSQGCLIKENEHGKCRGRINFKGELHSLVYGRPISIHIDPIEKKPFYHFLPGSEAYSLATAGCPLSCLFCQNWEISQSSPEDNQVKFIPPTEIVNNSKQKNVPIIAFTYNEPTTFFEYMVDIAREAKKQNIRSVLVSCGFMNPEPLKELCDVLDAIKIDLKGYSENFYKNVCNASLSPVLRTIKQIAKSKTHLEIVNLVVPTLNDSDKMMSELVNWLANEVGNNVPIHFTRFHPDYKLLNLPPTPISTIEQARDMAMSKGIHYAFVGNIPGHEGNNSYCPSCRKAIINRNGFFVTENNIKNGKCGFCGTTIAGVWK
jgi:pyruvate formate lyase activating enzyme